jgi:archaellum biogenesis ATPase FlaH
MDSYDNELERLQAGEFDNNQPPKRPLKGYILSHQDIIKKDIPPVEYLLGQWLPLQSLGMVYAKPAVGKSWFCMALVVALASAYKRFLGWSINKQVRSLIVDGEMSLSDIKERFLKLSPTGLDQIDILASEDMFLEGQPLSLDRPDHQEWFHQLLDDLEKDGRKPQVIVFDNLSTLRNSTNENDNSETQRLVSWLVSLRARGFTVLVVHHAGKNGDQRGASILTVPMNYVVKLTKPESDRPVRDGETRFEVSFDKMRARLPRPYEFSAFIGPDEAGVFQLTFNPTETNIEARYRLLRFIGKRGVLTHREMATAIDIGVGSIRNYLDKLMVEGFLEGLKSDPKISTDGLRLLHDFWPEEFSFTEQGRFVQSDDIPF